MRKAAVARSAAGAHRRPKITRRISTTGSYVRPLRPDAPTAENRVIDQEHHDCTDDRHEHAVQETGHAHGAELDKQEAADDGAYDP